MMSKTIQNALTSVCLSVLALVMVLFTHSANAGVISEDFESQTIGDTLPPAGWTLITEAGSPTYEAVLGSNGTGGGSGVAGRVNSTAFTGDVNLPGAYIVNSATFDSTIGITGSFDHQFAQEGTFDDMTFTIGDIGSGLTRVAGDALNVKFVENGDNRLTDGAGGVLQGLATTLTDDTWYRTSFTWTPTSGSTGDFSSTTVRLSDSVTVLSLATTGFTFTPTSLQVGFGSVNDNGIVDNINITSVPEPSSLALLLLSGVGLSLGRRRRKV